MGEGTNRVAQSNSSPARVRELGNETDAMRRQLDELVMELDRRRHELFDWRLQLRRHARALALIAGGIVVVVGIGVGVSVARSRRQHTLAARLAELADRGERLRQRPRTDHRRPRSPRAQGEAPSPSWTYRPWPPWPSGQPECSCPTSAPRWAGAGGSSVE